MTAMFVAGSAAFRTSVVPISRITRAMAARSPASKQIAETLGSLSRSPKREAPADTVSAMTSCSSTASFANLRADTVPTAPAPNTRTFTNSSFHCWRGTRSGHVGEPCRLRDLAPAADGGSQLKEMVSCESGPSALSEDANVPAPRRGPALSHSSSAPPPLVQPPCHTSLGQDYCRDLHA